MVKLGLPVVTSADLAQLVSAHALHSLVVCCLVVLDGDLRSHTTHGVDATLVASLDQEFHLMSGQHKYA